MKKTICSTLSAMAISCAASTPTPTPTKQECRPYVPEPGKPCGPDMSLMPGPQGYVCLCDEILERIRQKQANDAIVM